MRNELVSEIESLSPEAQKSVSDFVGFLRSGHAVVSRGAKTAKRKPLRSERFIGMWKKRADMKDSSAWVRNLRQQEWN